ncbi:MAG: hypothetical protein U1A78_01430 [Polyangia bacterium]
MRSPPAELPAPLPESGAGLGDPLGNRSGGRFGLAAGLRLRRRRGRILAVKWGYNPNSSSLGVDITFLLLGLSVITLLTPIVGFLLRFQRARSTAS